MKHDIAIIGGGSAGYAAARTAREEGADVAIVDPGPLGGLCILRGCMPSKAILRAADILSLMRRAPEFGLFPVEPGADLAAVMERKDRLVREFAEYRIGQLLSFPLYEETGSFLSPRLVRAGDQEIEADSFVIATGSLPARILVPGLDQIGCLTSDEALELRTRPESMLVLGGGPVAVELAQFFQRIGTRVTLIQRSAHILSTGDEDMARPVEDQFRAEGMEVYTGTRLCGFTRDGDLRIARFSHESRKKTAAAEIVLQAMGRRPNIDRLGLEAAGVEVEKGGIRVNAEMRTSRPHIFAAGDVNGLYESVHTAVRQGEIAAYNAVHPDRPPRRMDDRLKVQVVFTDPQVASLGLSEKECRKQGISYLSASHPFSDHGKSICMGETRGLVKLLCRPCTGELIGAHITGPSAGELIHELIAVMHFHGTVRDLAQMPHYHPTLAEIITYPAEELAGRL